MTLPGKTWKDQNRKRRRVVKTKRKELREKEKFARNHERLYGARPSLRRP